MIKKLCILYAFLIVPLFFYNFLRAQKLNQWITRNKELVLIQSKIKSFCSLEEQNKKTISDYLDVDQNYLFKTLEQLPLSNQKIQLVETFGEKNQFYFDKQETLAQAVDVDLTDIRSILECVEGNAYDHKPQLFFSEFSLKKNNHPDNIIYSLNFKIIKRDY